MILEIMWLLSSLSNFTVSLVIPTLSVLLNYGGSNDRQIILHSILDKFMHSFGYNVNLFLYD